MRLLACAIYEWSPGGGRRHIYWRYWRRDGHSASLITRILGLWVVATWQVGCRPALMAGHPAQDQGK